MSYSTLPIVGAFYRPPAKIILNNLAVGTPLQLMAEPDNPADPNAVAVWIETNQIPEAAYPNLEAALPEVGKTLEEVLDEVYVHLGYIPREFAAQLRASGVVDAEISLDVTFAVSASGAPRVMFPEPVL